MAETPNVTGTPLPAPPAPPAPPAAAVVKPVAPAKPAAKKPGRRSFITWFMLGMVALTTSLLGMILGTVRFLFPNVLSEAPSKFKVGDPRSFEEGKVVETFKDQGAWIVRNRDPQQGDIIYALSTTCTHLGCTPNWLEREGKFKCPCHGSGFKITGVNFEGPAPRPLERWALAVAPDDGQLVVDKSKKFQKELGGWNNTESYVKL